MSKTMVLMILLVLPVLAWAQDPVDPPPRLQLSWSATVQQDSLLVMDSGWTQCYLWADPSPLRPGFVGFWGTIYQSNAVEVHSWRYVGGGDDIDSDPAADEFRIGYLDIPCEDDTGARVLCEFEVWIDMDQLGDPGGRPSAIGMREVGNSEWDPMVFYRKDAADPCGYLSEGFAAEPNQLIVLPDPTPVHGSTFGTLKAIYR
jgi:hypothetical protein